MKKSNMGSSTLLMMTAFIWGIAFVAQSVGMDYVGPFTFNAVRFLIGGTVLLPVIYFLGKSRKRENGAKEIQDKNSNKTLIMGGICCGAFICVASLFQQFGISYTTVGKAGFITSLYIVIVPILGIFMKKRVSILIWLSAAVAMAGLYLLCMTESLSFSKGDFLVFISACLFSGHILVIDYFSKKVDGVKMSCIQFYIAGIISSVFMFIFENPTVFNILAGWMPILYAGVLSCGVAYTLQIIGQKNTEPVVASLILSLEAVFSVLAGWVLLGQTMNAREITGCVLVFVAIIMAQLTDSILKKVRTG